MSDKTSIKDYFYCFQITTADTMELMMPHQEHRTYVLDHRGVFVPPATEALMIAMATFTQMVCKVNKMH